MKREPITGSRARSATSIPVTLALGCFMPKRRRPNGKQGKQGIYADPVAMNHEINDLHHRQDGILST